MKNYSLIFLVLILLTEVVLSDTFLDYDYVFQCLPTKYGPKGSIRESKITKALDGINFHYIDAIVFIIFAPLACICSLFIIITFLMYKELRNSTEPGDIILGISASEFILSIHWFTTAIRFFTYPDYPPRNNETFCQTNAMFSIMAGTGEYLYNCCFCVYLILKNRSFVKPIHLPKIFYHSFAIGCAIILVLTMIATDNIGKSLFGTCSISAVSSLPILGPIILLIYLLLCVFTIFYWKKTIPNIEKTNEMKKEFLNFYHKYVQATLVIWSFIAFGNFFGVINCMIFNDPALNIVLTIGDYISNPSKKI